MIKVLSIDNVLIGTAKSRVKFSISPISDHKLFIPISALVLPRLSKYNPPKVKFSFQWNHLDNLDLADPLPFESKRIQLIIGAVYYGSLLMDGLRAGQMGTPTAQKTQFGVDSIRSDQFN